MSDLLARLARTLRPIGGYPDVVVAIKMPSSGVIYCRV